MSTCFIKTCPSRRKIFREDWMLRTGQEFYHFWRAPRGADRGQWTSHLPPDLRDQFNFENRSHVLCPLHFEDKFIVKANHFLVGDQTYSFPLSKWRLQQEAFPTIFDIETASATPDDGEDEVSKVTKLSNGLQEQDTNMNGNGEMDSNSVMTTNGNGNCDGGAEKSDAKVDDEISGMNVVVESEVGQQHQEMEMVTSSDHHAIVVDENCIIETEIIPRQVYLDTSCMEEGSSLLFRELGMDSGERTAVTILTEQELALHTASGNPSGIKVGHDEQEQFNELILFTTQQSHSIDPGQDQEVGKDIDNEVELRSDENGDADALTDLDPAVFLKTEEEESSVNNSNHDHSKSAFSSCPDKEEDSTRKRKQSLAPEIEYVDLCDEDDEKQKPSAVSSSSFQNAVPDSTGVTPVAAAQIAKMQPKSISKLRVSRCQQPSISKKPKLGGTVGKPKYRHSTPSQAADLVATNSPKAQTFGKPVTAATEVPKTSYQVKIPNPLTLIRKPLFVAVSSLSTNTIKPLISNHVGSAGRTPAKSDQLLHEDIVLVDIADDEIESKAPMEIPKFQPVNKTNSASPVFPTLSTADIRCDSQVLGDTSSVIDIEGVPEVILGLGSTTDSEPESSATRTPVVKKFSSASKNTAKADAVRKPASPINIAPKPFLVVPSHSSKLAHPNFANELPISNGTLKSSCTVSSTGIKQERSIAPKPMPQSQKQKRNLDEDPEWKIESISKKGRKSEPSNTTLKVQSPVLPNPSPEIATKITPKSNGIPSDHRKEDLLKDGKSALTNPADTAKNSSRVPGLAPLLDAERRGPAVILMRRNPNPIRRIRKRRPLPILSAQMMADLTMPTQDWCVNTYPSWKDPGTNLFTISETVLNSRCIEVIRKSITITANWEMTFAIFAEVVKKFELGLCATTVKDIQQVLDRFACLDICAGIPRGRKYKNNEILKTLEITRFNDFSFRSKNCPLILAVLTRPPGPGQDPAIIPVMNTDSLPTQTCKKCGEILKSLEFKGPSSALLNKQKQLIESEKV